MHFYVYIECLIIELKTSFVWSQNFKKQCNCVSPTQATILPKTPNHHHPYLNQEAKKYKRQSNSASNLVISVIAHHCKD